MRWFVKTLTLGLLAVASSATGLAQGDICQEPLPSVAPEARLQLLDAQRAERLRLEEARRTWVVSIVPVKNAPSTSALQPLCIFNIEVVPHLATKLVAIRAPKELMPAVEDALKRLDVPVRPPRTAELTAYVLIATDSSRPGLMPVPQELQSVASQLKNVLAGGTLYLADTVIARSLENTRMILSGNTGLDAMMSIREGTPATVRLHNLLVNISNDSNRGPANFNTDIEVPVGSFVVVGKATRQSSSGGEAAILVMTAKVFE
jgi:hypothetical protein